MDYVGRPFQLGKVDCFTLLRDYYKTEFDIELPNVARPDEFWDHGLDLYNKHCHRNGFQLLDLPSREWQRGDVILMAIMSPLPNHAAILVEDGKILHHVYGRLSTIEDYRGIWRNNTTGVYRHKDVVIPAEEAVEVDIRDLLSPAKRRMLDALAADRE